MTKFICGLDVDLVPGLVGSTPAAQLAGGTGYLIGWEVTIGGETIRRRP